MFTCMYKRCTASLKELKKGEIVSKEISALYSTIYFSNILFGVKCICGATKGYIMLYNQHKCVSSCRQSKVFPNQLHNLQK